MMKHRNDDGGKVESKNVNVLMRLLPLVPCTHNSTNKRAKEKWKNKTFSWFCERDERKKERERKKTEKRIM
jgi:hypothetical protein